MQTAYPYTWTGRVSLMLPQIKAFQPVSWQNPLIRSLFASAKVYVPRWGPCYAVVLNSLRKHIAYESSWVVGCGRQVF
jgi:hypothetical protein